MFFPLPLHQNCFVKGTTGTHAATPNSHLSVLIYLSSHRSRARSSLPSRWLTVFTWLLNCAPLVVLSPHWLLCLLFCFFLFLPTNNNGLCFKAQSWHPIILFLHHLPSESQSFKHHLCFFCLICALQSSSLLLWHKDTLHFSLLFYNPLSANLRARGVLEFRWFQT